MSETVNYIKKFRYYKFIYVINLKFTKDEKNESET